MDAIQFNATIPRYLIGLGLKKIWPGILWSGLSCTALIKNAAEPDLPGEDWVRIKTILGGICGSDLGEINLKTSPYFEPLSSFPHVMGHENVGVIAEVGRGVSEWKPGDRVVVEPLLWCVPRGFDELCTFCERGEINRCERVAEGRISSGILIGACRDTGGSWGSAFVAHQCQLYQVPDSISSESALMVEPFAVGIHAALTAFPRESDKVLIIGGGTIGLSVLAAIRALGSMAKIILLVRHPFQADAAQRLGASQVILEEDNPIVDAGEALSGKIMKPLIGREILIGGADLTFDCIGSNQSIDQALRLTRSGGRVALVGLPGVAQGIDLSALFAKELQVLAANTYHHAEIFEGRKWTTFELAIFLMENKDVDLSWMVTHKYKLVDYAQAFSTLRHRSRTEMIKAVFEF